MIMRATGRLPIPDPRRLYVIEKAKRAAWLVIEVRHDWPDPKQLKANEHEMAKRAQERGGWDWRRSAARGKKDA